VSSMSNYRKTQEIAWEGSLEIVTMKNRIIKE
jgi:hypothetical protein